MQMCIVYRDQESILVHGVPIVIDAHLYSSLAGGITLAASGMRFWAGGRAAWPGAGGAAESSGAPCVWACG
mgnify:CR=1 FL=1